MDSIVRLVDMAEYGKPYFPRCGHVLQELVAIIESDGIQPFAAHCYRRVMQADHDIGRSRSGDLVVEPRQFGGLDVAAGTPRHATIYANDPPVARLDGRTIMKRWSVEDLLHQRAHVVISRYTVNRQAQCKEQIAEVRIGLSAIVLDQVPGDDGQVGAPVAVAIVIYYRAQRRIRHRAAQIAPDVSEQVGISKVQYPQ